MFHSVLLEFIGGRGPQTHIPYQDIPELGQLVQTPFSEKPAQLGHPRIVGNLEENSVPAPLRC